MEATQAFENLKKAMTEVPVLALPDFEKPFLIETDASGYGLGAVLTQEGRPIAYYSQVLSAQARLRGIYEKELMAIVLAVNKWRPYLLGRRFIVRTDQKALKFLLEQRLVAEEHQKWLIKLLGYDFEIQYKPGKENQAADSLSRKSPDQEGRELAACATISAQVLDWAKLEAENQSPTLDPERKLAAEGSEDYILQGTRLFFKGRFMLPAKSSQIPVIIKEFHASSIGGHSGILMTYSRLKREFYWPHMKKDVTEFISKCDVCQRNKSSTQRPGGLLQPLELPTKVWSDISMDFIEGLPKVEGQSVILVVVDRLSKYGHFIPVSHPYTAKSISEVFIKEIVRLHGIPETIVSDRDAIFTSNLWSALFKALGTSLKRSSAYHPQTDGQTEVVNRSVGTYLRCFAAHQPRRWVKYLPWAEYWYNTSYHTATKMTPFQILYGRDPPRLVPYEKGSSPSPHVENELEDRDEVLRDVAKQLARSQRKMKENADLHRRDVQFKEGDWVYIKLQVRRQQSVVLRPENKLAPKYFGPYKIIRKIGEVAYRVQLPDKAQIHPVFHVSQLKKYDGTLRPSEVHDLRWFHGYKSRYTPKELLGLREGTEGPEVLIHWHGLPPEEATWEPLHYIHERFPEFDLLNKTEEWKGENPGTSITTLKMIQSLDLEDKVLFKGGGTDMNSTHESLKSFGGTCGNLSSSQSLTPRLAHKLQNAEKPQSHSPGSQQVPHIPAELRPHISKVPRQSAQGLPQPEDTTQNPGRAALTTTARPKSWPVLHSPPTNIVLSELEGLADLARPPPSANPSRRFSLASKVLHFGWPMGQGGSRKRKSSISAGQWDKAAQG